MSKAGFTAFTVCSKLETFSSALLSNSEISCFDGILARMASIDLFWAKQVNPTRSIANQVFIFQPPSLSNRNLLKEENALTS